MSTDRSRLVSSIRRIVLTDPDLSSALDAWQNRGDQASSTGVGTSDAERDRLCCDGSTSSNPNPGADTRNTSEGGQEGLNDDDPALLDSGPGSLTGVTDCATGEPICFDGNDWLPPEGWDGPTDPPVDPTYTEGEFWKADDGGGDDVGFGATRQAAIDDTEFARSDCIQCSTGNDVVGRPLTANASTDCSGATFLCGGDQGYDGFDSYDVNQQDCTGEHEAEPYCNPSEEDTLLDSWPEDGCTSLAIKSGTIVGSKYDPENDGTYSKPMSEIELCDGSGNSFLLRPSANGGWKSIKSLDGEPDGAVQNGWLYSAYGDVIQQITPSEFSDPKV